MKIKWICGIAGLAMIGLGCMAFRTPYLDLNVPKIAPDCKVSFIGWQGYWEPDHPITWAFQIGKWEFGLRERGSYFQLMDNSSRHYFVHTNILLGPFDYVANVSARCVVFIWGAACTLGLLGTWAGFSRQGKRRARALALMT